MKIRKSFILYVLFATIMFMLAGSLKAQGGSVGAHRQKTQELVIKEKSDPSVSSAIVYSPVSGESKNYTLGKGDVLEILVRNNPEFSGLFPVGPDGNLQYTFVGDIKADGLTKDQLKDIIAEKLTKYIKVPEVNISIQAYLSKFVYIFGEVGNPGKFPMKGDTVELLDLVVAAGLPTPAAALRRAYVIKPDSNGPPHQRVDLVKLLYKGIMDDNLTLEPGTVVVVPTTIPYEFNRALTVLLSPFRQLRDGAELANYYGAGADF